jgi:hypothetical protein
VEKRDIFSLCTRDTFTSYAKSKGYHMFKSDTSYDLNIWGVRTINQHAGDFDDWLFVFTNTIFEHYKVTVDPSDLYLLTPIHPLGTAIIKPGQYRGVWSLGYHKNSKDHPALVQSKPITVIRDFNRDGTLDFDKPEYLYARNNVNGKGITEFYNDQNKVIFRTHEGLFGINCHRASKWKILEKIGLHSAGCVVHYDPTRYDKEFIPLIKKAVEVWGNSFTFTLITERELRTFLNEPL